MMWFLGFGLGAIAGSVANALIYRLPRGQSWVHGRSVCPSCKHSLTWRDLIPLISYLFLGGKCRYCHKKIGVRYFVIELILALSFSVLIAQPIVAAIAFFTVVIAGMDWETQLVSEWLVLIWAVLVIINSQLSMANFWGILVGIGVIGGLWLVTRGQAMGFGDIEIVAVMGLWLGWPKVALALWLAFVLGAIVGVFLVIHQKSNLKARIAFGPFLILSTWITYFWGSAILSLIRY